MSQNPRRTVDIPIKVLFVCMGNICRSPAADNIFRHMVEQAGLAGRIEIDSAGTIGYHAGKAPDPRMSDELAALGYPVHGSARQVTRADLDQFDLVLAMDDDNLADLDHLARDGSPAATIKLLTTYCSRPEIRKIPDPYFGGRRGFGEAVDIIEDACRGLLDELRRQLDER